MFNILKLATGSKRSVAQQLKFNVVNSYDGKQAKEEGSTANCHSGLDDRVKLI